MTEKEYKILKAIEPGTYDRGVDAKAVAWALWHDDIQNYDPFIHSVTVQGIR